MTEMKKTNPESLAYTSFIYAFIVKDLYSASPIARASGNCQLIAQINTSS